MVATKTTRFPAGLWPDQEISSRDSAPGGLWSEQRGVATAYTKCADTRVAIAALAEGTADAAPVPVFLLLFLGGRHDPETALDAVKATFPGTPLLGVSGTGVIASEAFGYTGFEAGVIAWADDRTAPRLAVTTRLTEWWLLAGDAVHRHAAAALVFPRRIQATTEILRACRPVSAFMQITRIDGDRVLEIDGRPAMDVVNGYLLSPLINADGHPSRILVFGKKHGDRFGPTRTANFTNRLILTGDPETKSITLFEPDSCAGDWVQLMSHDPDLMIDEARNGARACRADLPAFRPLVRLYIDCAGRARVMSATPVEEAGIVQGELLNDPTPLMGFYSGVEIAPVDHRSRSLDWTGVLTTLVETV